MMRSENGGACRVHGSHAALRRQIEAIRSLRWAGMHVAGLPPRCDCENDSSCPGYQVGIEAQRWPVGVH